MELWRGKSYTALITHFDRRNAIDCYNFREDPDMCFPTEFYTTKNWIFGRRLDGSMVFNCPGYQG